MQKTHNFFNRLPDEKVTKQTKEIRRASFEFLKIS